MTTENKEGVVMLPTNGASMADAENTREDESEHICDSCEHYDTDACLGDPAECLAQMREQAADDAIKARKERDL